MNSDQTRALKSLISLGDLLNPQNKELLSAISRTYAENNWLTEPNYLKSLSHWAEILNEKGLTSFMSPYSNCSKSLRVGVIMAGNIPMVGFHDLLCVLLSGHTAIVKPSSDDKYVMNYICETLNSFGLQKPIEVAERLEGIDAVIATGSNNSHRYFEYYFRTKPSLLRKNRKSIAILSGNESLEELNLLSDDIFTYFGLGCRNVSTIAIPEGMDITKILDQTMSWQMLTDHNKYANNYTYHRALLLMNQAHHLDTGFCLIQNKRDLNAPLACLYYFEYKNEDDIREFLEENAENIQCTVGNYSDVCSVPFGESQKPDLQDYADGIDTMHFLSNLDKSTI